MFIGKSCLYSGKQTPSQAYARKLLKFSNSVKLVWVYCTLRIIVLPLDLWNPMTNSSCYFLQGDSGGPLVCERPGGQWTLFGLTSWGSVCFSKVLGPGVYSNVSYFVEWIERQIYIQTFLQKELEEWSETLPETHTRMALLTAKSVQSVPLSAVWTGFSWAGCPTCQHCKTSCLPQIHFTQLLIFFNFFIKFTTSFLKAQTKVGFVFFP